MTLLEISIFLLERQYSVVFKSTVEPGYLDFISRSTTCKVCFHYKMMIVKLEFLCFCWQVGSA